MPGLKRRGLETERQTGVTVTGVAQPTGRPAEHEGPRTYHTGEATAPVPDPTQIDRLEAEGGTVRSVVITIDRDPVTDGIVLVRADLERGDADGFVYSEAQVGLGAG